MKGKNSGKIKKIYVFHYLYLIGIMEEWKGKKSSLYEFIIIPLLLKKIMKKSLGYRSLLTSIYQKLHLFSLVFMGPCEKLGTPTKFSFLSYFEPYNVFFPIFLYYLPIFYPTVIKFINSYSFKFLRKFIIYFSIKRGDYEFLSMFFFLFSSISFLSFLFSTQPNKS